MDKCINLPIDLTFKVHSARCIPASIHSGSWIVLCGNLSTTTISGVTGSGKGGGLDSSNFVSFCNTLSTKVLAILQHQKKSEIMSSENKFVIHKPFDNSTDSFPLESPANVKY